MSRSSLAVATYLSPNKTSPRNAPIDTITIHCVVGQWSVDTIGNYFLKSSVGASCNYGVGTDGRVVLVVDEGDRSWCSSNGDNDHRAVTIEVASDTTSPYAVTSEALEGLIQLCADICQRNGIEKLLWQGDSSLIGQVDKQNMTVHRWFANKACPGDYLYELHGYIADEVNKIINQEEDEDMTQETFQELFQQLRSNLQDNDSGEWSREAREWATGTGLLNGNGTTVDGEPNMMWEDLLTREQLVTVLYRFAQMMGQV